MNHRPGLCLVVIALALFACVGRPGYSAAVSAGTFSVSGDVRIPGTWSATRIESDLKSDIQTVNYTLKGQNHTADAVPLLALIEAAEPEVNPKIKHHELQFVVSVQGYDGYTVDFSLAELLPSFGNRHVWIALDEDGKPLVEEGGALQILSPDDVKPARWVHGIAVISVADSSKLETHV